ncbi:MAG: HEAT repeat domain-containing protein [Candidatus Brocadiia bacterium]
MSHAVSPSRLLRSRGVARPWAALAALLLAAAAAHAAEAQDDLLAQLDAALQEVAVYEYGKDFAPLRRAEDLVAQAAKDPALREEAEKRLVARLRGEATDDAKAFLCRQLRLVGTARCVPALASLLASERLSHMARYALERIPAPEAGAALRQALPRASAKLKVGVIHSLGARGDREALDQLVPLLGAGDLAVARAAARALGYIGGERAAQALAGARPGASPELRRTLTAAWLRCADQFLDAGQAEKAAAIYRALYGKDEPRRTRVAALRGLVAAGDEQAVPRVLEAIQGDDPLLRASAIQFLKSARGPGLTELLADKLASFPPEVQVLVLGALAERGAAGAAPAALAAARSEHEEVRIAALEALGRVGDAAAVPILAEAAATGQGREQQAARQALARLGGEGVDAAIVAALEKGGDAATRAELVRALAERGATQALHVVLELARGAEEPVRGEALRAIGELAGPNDLARVARLVAQATDEATRQAAAKALIAVLGRLPDRAAATEPVLEAMDGAPPQARAALLGVLARIGTSKALAAVRSALDAPQAAVRDAALRALAEWPTAEPIADLLRIAREATDRRRKVLALRGLLRMVNETAERSEEQKAALYRQAMDLASRPEEKKLVLAGLAEARSLAALRLAESALDEPAVRAEAAAAAAQIASGIAAAHQAEARAVLQKLARTAPSEPLREQARRALGEIDKLKGYILAWEAAGPYRQKGKEAQELFDMAFPPEKPDAKDVAWRRVTRGVAEHLVDLEQALGGGDQQVGYLRTRVWSPKAQKARLELGSDDGVKAWLNGEPVHANNALRGLTPGQDVANVTLREGWNALMLKVTEASGAWQVCCRLRAPDGAPLEGLKVRPGGG